MAALVRGSGSRCAPDEVEPHAGRARDTLVGAELATDRGFVFSCGAMSHHGGLFSRGLYAIVDLEALGSRDPCRFASIVLDCGAVAVQLRGKTTSSRELVAVARGLRPLCVARRVPLIIDDRVDVAIASGADGVHVGQDDLGIDDVREVLRGSKSAVRIVGVSTHDLDQVRSALCSGADYIGFGPVFATASKSGHEPPVGIEGVGACVRESTRPVVAIGGIDTSSASAIAAAGAHAVAVIGDLARASDPAAVAKKLQEAFR